MSTDGAGEISAERFRDYCQSKDFSEAYLIASPLLRRSLVTGIRMALCEPIEAGDMVINNSLTGVLQGALDAIIFFQPEVDEHAAIAHVASLLGHAEFVNSRTLFKSGFEYFGNSLQRRCVNTSVLFANHLIDVAATDGNESMLRQVLGINTLPSGVFVTKVVIPAFAARKDISRLSGIFTDNFEFGDFCIKNGLTHLIRHVKSRSQRGSLLEIGIGI